LFRYSDERSQARVLLLSATPYKMYTMTDIDSDENHYQDFERTLRFLQDDNKASERTNLLIGSYRRELRNIATGEKENLARIKVELEAELRRVMVRTEKLAVSGDRNGMLKEFPSAASPMTTSDALTYVSLQKIADS